MVKAVSVLCFQNFCLPVYFRVCYLVCGTCGCYIFMYVICSVCIPSKVFFFFVCVSVFGKIIARCHVPGVYRTSEINFCIT